MQTSHPLPEQLFIHRHCIQQLLHEAITQEQKHCHGLLIGSGNVITKCLSVTDKRFHAPVIASKPEQKDAVLGAYIATDKSGVVDMTALTQRFALLPDYGQQTPCYFLVLYLDHKGRIDARLYADLELQISVPLNMQEDRP